MYLMQDLEENQSLSPYARHLQGQSTFANFVGHPASMTLYLLGVCATTCTGVVLYLLGELNRLIYSRKC